MTINEFFDKWNNKGCDFDGYYGFQCVDLADQYAKEVCNALLPGVAGAKDFWNLDIKGYQKIANTPTGIPQKGDIIIWGVGVGQYGHIAIFDHGDANNFTSFDQNWPVNSLCHFQNHNYNGVLGWFRPNNAVTAQVSIEIPTITQINDQTKYDFGGDIGTQELGAIRSIINDTRRDLKSCQEQSPLTLANFSLPDLIKELLGRLKLG